MVSSVFFSSGGHFTLRQCRYLVRGKERLRDFASTCIGSNDIYPNDTKEAKVAQVACSCMHSRRPYSFRMYRFLGMPGNDKSNSCLKGPNCGGPGGGLACVKGAIAMKKKRIRRSWVLISAKS